MPLSKGISEKKEKKSGLGGIRTHGSPRGRAAKADALPARPRCSPMKQSVNLNYMPEHCTLRKHVALLVVSVLPWRSPWSDFGVLGLCVYLRASCTCMRSFIGKAIGIVPQRNRSEPQSMRAK